MPVYRFFCSECSKQKEELQDEIKLPFCECGKEMRRVYVAPQVKLTVKTDPWKNKNAIKDIDPILVKRSHEHFLKNIDEAKANAVRQLQKAAGMDEQAANLEAVRMMERAGWVDKKSGKVKGINE